METDDNNNEMIDDLGIELPIVIKLSKPLKIAKDETTNEIVIKREPIAADFKGLAADNMKFDDALKLMSRVSGIAIPLLEKLPARDMIKVSKVINSFLGLNG